MSRICGYSEPLMSSARQRCALSFLLFMPLLNYLNWEMVRGKEEGERE